jgi:hypothetical protein
VSRTIDELVDKADEVLAAAAWERLDLALTNCRHYADELAERDTWVEDGERQILDRLRDELNVAVSTERAIRGTGS